MKFFKVASTIPLSDMGGRSIKTPSSIVIWVNEVGNPPHHKKVTAYQDGGMNRNIRIK